MLLYRIAKKIFIEDLTGYGAQLYGGRWNEKGMPALYTSSSLSLCTLEVLVHCEKSVFPRDMYFAELEFPDSLIPEDFFEAGKDEDGEQMEDAYAGIQWLKSKSSAAIKVRSAILPQMYEGDFNVILNPRHSDFSKLEIKTCVECPFDLRLYS